MFFLKSKKEILTEPENKKKDKTWFDFLMPDKDEKFILKKSIQKTAPVPVSSDGTAMDSACENIKLAFNARTRLPASIFDWYASQGFIGYQACAILSQNWLIDKACTIPAQDAIRKGYEISINDGSEISTEIINEIYSLDKEYYLNKNLIQFERMCRIFGIRIALFKVESDDPDYYLKPFNLDGVLPGSYKGIVQIDPYWITPELDFQSSSNPAGIDYRDHSATFYDPTWWRVNGQRIHKSHFIIIKNCEVPDILKPTYIYGGISIPQKIYERVYASERTANEAPILAMSKRLNIYKTDLSKALGQEGELLKTLNAAEYLRDNFGTRVIDLEEEIQQIDTSLSDLDNLIMTQYQLVAACANIPSTKLLGTQPKGFNSSGEYEEASYHEELESIQENHLIPLIDRHHQLIIKSIIIPKYEIEEFNIETVFNSLDSMTSEEQANLNKLKAETASQLYQIGAINGDDERKRIIGDKYSGYNGVDEEIDRKEELNEEFQNI